MKYIMLSIYLCLSYTICGQVIQKDTIITKCSFGLFPNLYYLDQLVDDQTDEFAKIFSCELRPYFSYNLYQNIYMGCYLSYEFFESNFYKKENFIELGIFSRYIVPYTINKRLLNRLHMYFEIGYYKTNYRIVSYIANTFEYKDIIIEEDFITSNKLNQNKLSFPIGITFHASKHLYIDLNWQYIKYINGANKKGFMCGIGYNFGKKQ